MQGVKSFLPGSLRREFLRFEFCQPYRFTRAEGPPSVAKPTRARGAPCKSAGSAPQKTQPKADALHKEMPKFKFGFEDRLELHRTRCFSASGRYSAERINKKTKERQAASCSSSMGCRARCCFHPSAVYHVFEKLCARTWQAPRTIWSNTPCARGW